MSAPGEPFPSEALAENRSGHLTPDQATRFRNMVGVRARGVRGLAVPVGAIGAALFILTGPAATAARRHLLGGAFAAAAVTLLAVPALDPLAADVRDGRVKMIDGAVSKQRVQSVAHTGRTRYYLNIEDRHLRTFPAAWEAAPDAGYVRAYYLPRTRRLVNLERLPNPPVPASPDDARAMVGRIGRAMMSGNRTTIAEARAGAAGLMDAIRESIVEPADAADAPIEGGLAPQSLVGTWKHPLATVTLAEDGTLTVTSLMGASQSGHWSVDAEGRLLTDATGTMAPTAATLDDDRLTVRLEGRQLTFTRAARG